MWGVLEKSAVILAKARISLGVSEIAVFTAMTEYGFYSPRRTQRKGAQSFLFFFVVSL